MLMRAWRQWIRLATIIGTFQMMVILTVIYWTMLAMIAIPYKLLADPLSLRASSKPKWISRPRIENAMDFMKLQG